MKAAELQQLIFNLQIYRSTLTLLQRQRRAAGRVLLFSRCVVAAARC